MTNLTKQLGHQPIPDGTFEHDLAVQERYQNFSAELLRLSLLGIGAIGFISINTILGGNDDRIPLPDVVRITTIFALISFGLAAIAALIHRYCITDMLSWQIQSLRRDVRNTEKDKLQSEKDRNMRYLRFKISKHSIVLSAVFLAIGGLSLAFGFGFIIKTI